MINEQEKQTAETALVTALMNKGLTHLQMDLVALVQILQIQSKLNVKLKKVYDEQFKELIDVANEVYTLYTKNQAK